MRNALVTTLARFRKDEKGVTLVEYGIAIVLAVAVGTAALTTLADDISDSMGRAGGCMAPASGTVPTTC